MYSVRYRESAKRELEECAVYGLSEPIHNWLAELAIEAERRDYALSFDLRDLLESLGDPAARSSGSWRYSLDKWLEADGIKRIGALITVLRKRSPPWELRASNKTLPVLGGAFASEIAIFYEVDHGARGIIVSKFIGLPGQ